MNLGRYLLGPRLAQGGMGEVFLATQVGLGDFQKPLALKLMLPHLAEHPAAVQMFLHEARLAARMNHPNVVQIFDVGKEQGRYFLAMELVQGVSMAVLIRRLQEAGRQLPLELLLYVARALCEGLHHAHEQRGSSGEALQIVHRDVSPHNVLLSVDGALKLTDFGIAKARDTDQAMRQSVHGKLEYMAPEQLRGEDADRRADVYAAAISLFQLATWVSPFRRGTPELIHQAVTDEPLPPLESWRPDLPPAFGAALARAAEKSKERRFPTARALREALPLLSDAEGAERLGALVRELCEAPLEVLDSKTRMTVAGRTSTTTSSSTTAATLFRAPLAGTARPRAAKLAVAGAVIVTVGLLVAAGVLNRPPSPAPPPPQSGPLAEVATTAAASEPEVPKEADRPRPPSPEAVSQAAAPARERLSRASGRARLPAAQAPAAQAPAAAGYLSVDAVPWAQVYVDGKRVGETPISRLEVPAGKRTVRFENPELQRVVSRTVLVPPSQWVRLKEDLR